jgi:hypothetical protein
MSATPEDDLKDIEERSHYRTVGPGALAGGPRAPAPMDPAMDFPAIRARLDEISRQNEEWARGLERGELAPPESLASLARAQAPIVETLIALFERVRRLEIELAAHQGRPM